MISAMFEMLTCRWSARRIQRYLDADPSARLGPEEVRRFEAHLATCHRCSAAVADYRGILGALARRSQRRTPDPAAMSRLRLAAEQIRAQDVR